MYCPYRKEVIISYSPLNGKQIGTSECFKECLKSSCPFSNYCEGKWICRKVESEVINK